jgi:hypothetical protein
MPDGSFVLCIIVKSNIVDFRKSCNATQHAQKIAVLVPNVSPPISHALALIKNINRLILKCIFFYGRTICTNSFELKFFNLRLKTLRIVFNTVFCAACEKYQQQQSNEQSIHLSFLL